MVEYCRKNRTPEPEFSEDSGGFSVVFPFKESMHTAVVMHESMPHGLTSRQKEIITILEIGGEMSLKDIIQQLNHPPAERTVREDMTALKKLGFIDSSGLSRATTWFVIK